MPFLTQKKSVRLQEYILNQAMKEIRKLLKELELEGKDLKEVKLKKFSKTHHISCICEKCKRAKTTNSPKSRGLREYGFKVYVHEKDPEVL